MKLHHYALAFFALIFATLAIVSIRKGVVNRTYKQAVKCENELTSSLLDAMTDAVDMSQTGEYLFNTEYKRKVAYDEFYATLSLNLNEYLTKDTYIRDTIPCLFLVDTDGYYVVYREEDADNTLQTKVSPLNTWSEYVGNGTWLIKYYLSDWVTIIDRSTGEHYDGHVEDVKIKTDNDGLSYVLHDYLASYEDYCAKREYCIYKTMEEQLNYYVNKYNVNAQYCYDLTIPMTTGIQEGHPIDKPCMFALMQGKYLGLSGTHSNVYAYANGEEITERAYYASNDGYYHKGTCPSLGTVKYKGSMKDCARHGYTPCPDCN